MKTLSCFVLVLVVFPFSYSSFALESINFDNEIYKHAWTGSEANAKLLEFTTRGESVDNWKSLVTLQCHPEAKEVKDVTGPYYEARKKLVAMRPEIIENNSAYRKDLNLVLFLGAPGKTEHIEFVISRFIKDNQAGVYSVIYSHRFPASKNVNVSYAINNKDRWIKELAAIPLQSIVKFCNE